MVELTIFVPEYINPRNIEKCLYDPHANFVNISSSTFDVAAKLKELDKFIVLETDHFVAYLAPPAHDKQLGIASYKCSYSIRNWVIGMMPSYYIMYQLLSVDRKENINLVNGIINHKHPPVLYFVSEENADCLACNDEAEYHAIVEYFEEDDSIDFAKLGEIAKTKTCTPHFFVVNKAADYYAVDTNDTEIRYKFSAAIKYKIITEMASGGRTIEDCYEEDRQIAERLSEMRFDPDFQLRDREGVPLGEESLFSLQIIEENDIENEADFDRELEYVDFFGLIDRNKPFFYGTIESGTVFGFKVLNGITYLTYGDKYLFISDSKSRDLVAGPRIPAKSQRIRLVYTESGDISLFTWDRSAFAICDWFKEAYGAIEFKRDEYTMRWEKPMRLRIELYHDTRVEKEDWFQGYF